MAAPAHMLSLAAEFALILGEIHPEHSWDVEVGRPVENVRGADIPAAPAREASSAERSGFRKGVSFETPFLPGALPWPDATTEGEAS